MIWTSLLVVWKFLAAWSISGCSADEPAMVSLPLRVLVPACCGAAEALVGLVEVVDGAEQAISSAPTTSPDTTNARGIAAEH